MTRVLLTAHAVDKLAAQLAELAVTPVVLEGRVEDIQVAWGSSDLFRVPEETRRFFGAVVHSPTVRWVQVSGAGTDDPVFARLLAKGVIVTTSHVTGAPIAEYVLRAVLDWYQRADEWRVAARDRRWEDHEFREVLGTTWLVLGLGSIGIEVAARARAFGAHVIGMRRTPVGDEPVDELIAPRDLYAALDRADVVVLAVPALAATVGMVDSRFLGAMRKGSLLVNVARGSLVDEAALLSALDRGVPDAAFLDVTATEPPPDDSPLWAHPRIALTAHSSGLGLNRHDRAAAFFIANLRRYVNGEPLVNIVSLDDVPSPR